MPLTTCCIFPRRRHHRQSSSSPTSNRPSRSTRRDSSQRARFPISTDNSTAPAFAGAASSSSAGTKDAPLYSKQRLTGISNHSEDIGKQDGCDSPKGSHARVPILLNGMKTSVGDHPHVQIDSASACDGSAEGLASRNFGIRKSTSYDTGIATVYDAGGMDNRSTGQKKSQHDHSKEDSGFDWLGSKSLYESDAVPLKTPQSTWSRQLGPENPSVDVFQFTISQNADSTSQQGKVDTSLNNINNLGPGGPRHLDRVLERSASPCLSLPPSHKDLDRKNLQTKSAGSRTTARSVSGVLTQMLISRAENEELGTRDSLPAGRLVKGNITMQKEEPEESSRQRFVFEDGNTPEQQHTGEASTKTMLRQISAAGDKEYCKGSAEGDLWISPALERSDTIIHAPRDTNLVDADQSGVVNTSKPSVPMAALPQTAAVVASKVVGGFSKLPFAGYLVPDSSHSRQDIEGPNQANGLFEPLMGRLRRLSLGLVQQRDNPATLQEKGDHECDSTREKENSGGVDGNASSASDGRSLLHDKQNRSSNSELSSIHHHIMHVPQQLVSREVNQSVSMPQTRRFNPSDSQRRSDETDAFAGKPMHRSSTTSFRGAQPSSIYGLPSVYIEDYKYLTPAESNQGSVIHLPVPSSNGTVATEMITGDGSARTQHNGQEIVSVRPSSGKPIDLDRLERRTHETSFHSSNEDLTNRELASAERRIVPVDQACPIRQPKDSMFKEDFEDISREIERTNPSTRRGRNVSWFDGVTDQGESAGVNGLRVRSDDQSSKFSKRSIKSDEGAASAWERALREHAKEDRTLARTRLGSQAPSPRSGRSFSASRWGEEIGLGRSSEELGQIGFSINQRRQVENPIDIRTRLEAYKLPPRPLDPPKPQERPFTDGNGINYQHRQPGSPSAWARYPSHTLSQRSPALAGEADGVKTRDFAHEQGSSSLSSANSPDPTFPLPAKESFHLDDMYDFDQKAYSGDVKHNRQRHKTPAMLLLSNSAKAIAVTGKEETKSGPKNAKGKQTSTTSFGHVMEKLKGVYRVGGLEFQRRYAFESRGHRSSISDGRLVEYPELEMLPPSSPLPSPVEKNPSPSPSSASPSSSHGARNESGIPNPAPHRVLPRRRSVSSVASCDKTFSPRDGIGIGTEIEPNDVQQLPPKSPSVSPPISPAEVSPSITLAGASGSEMAFGTDVGARAWSKMYRNCIGGKDYTAYLSDTSVDQIRPATERGMVDSPDSVGEGGGEERIESEGGKENEGKISPEKTTGSMENDTEAGHLIVAKSESTRADE